MKHSNENKIVSANKKEQQRKLKQQPGAWLDQPLALIASLALMPVWIVNCVVAVFLSRSSFSYITRLDAVGQEVAMRSFSSGYFKQSAVVIDICLGRIGFVGTSMNHTVDYQTRNDLKDSHVLKPGLVSLYDVHRGVGLDEETPESVLLRQLESSTGSYVTILLKAILNWLWFTSKDMLTPKVVQLFGVRLNNVDMKRAVQWALTGAPLERNKPIAQGRAQVGYYVNAHSVNTLSSDPEFKSCLNRADALFADGSGMRLAAKSKGINLVANLNGTDMLPNICKTSTKNGQSLFFLGGKPGVAKKAGKKLTKKYGSLRIAGTHHGYFDFQDEATSLEMVEQINQSGADVVLVGFGSPFQELWCEKYAGELECKTVLAVGGLFDYYSGSIPRAPLFMREVGLEWIWRLIQEPKAKFGRYVVGTPQFLIRTFLLRQV